LRYWSQVDHRDNQGLTSINAMRYRDANDEIVEMLIMAGAKCSLVASSGESVSKIRGR